MQAILRKKTREGVLRPKAATALLDAYRRFFDAYTYLDSPTEAVGTEEADTL